MPQFILVLVLVIVLLPLGIAKLLLDYRAKQNSHGRDVTLTVAELENLVRRYVEDATAPLHDRIQELEEALRVKHDRDRTPSSSNQPLIDDPSLEGENLRVDEQSRRGSEEDVT